MRGAIPREVPMRHATFLAALLAGAALAAPPAGGTVAQAFNEKEIVAHVYEPQQLEATDERIAG
jgi:hypothetical protein